MASYIVNGEVTDFISVEDRALNYGDGVFETLVIKDSEPRHWQSHWQRLEMGCQRLRIAAPDEKILHNELQLLLDKNHISQDKQYVLKIIVSRGIGKRGYKPPMSPQITRIIGIFPYPEYPDSYFRNGVKITVCKTPLSCNPILAGIKHLNRLEQVMAQDEFNSPDIVDGIMLNSDQHVVECTMSNVFWITNNQLVTPDLSNCGVAGVTRENILQLAKELQIPTTIDYFDIKDLYEADEIFISNSVFGILPVRALDGYQKSVGPLTRKLMKALSQ